jgi:UDP-N-acetylglucosamine--dolichyl-phosphate N-acetylglucosaminephosphotransferase
MYNAYLTIIVPAVITFFVSLFGTEFLISYLYGAGIIAEDNNKEKAIRIASSGGLAVAFGITVGILSYTFGASFIYKPILSVAQLLAVSLAIILIALVGFLDDVNVKRTKVQSTDRKDIRQGLKQWQKPLLTFIGALPLMAINAGISTVAVPLLGVINFGYFYPLILIPLAVIFVSNAVNLLGGFDGLQPGTTVVAAFGLFAYSALFGNNIGLLLSTLLFVSILGFLPFNLYRAKIIPGDSFTYAVGGTFAAIMIMGHAEAFGVIIFIPWIIEFLLHARRKFKVTDLGIRQKDGTFKAPYGKNIYSLTHVIMNIKRATEIDVALYLTLFEALFVILGFALKLAGVL